MHSVNGSVAHDGARTRCLLEQADPVTLRVWKFKISASGRHKKCTVYAVISQCY